MTVTVGRVVLVAYIVSIHILVEKRPSVNERIAKQLFDKKKLH